MQPRPFVSSTSTTLSVLVPSDEQSCIDTVVFAHHPCPDGIAAVVCLQTKFGTTKTRYAGLNHGEMSAMRENLFSEISPGVEKIIFVDVVPPVELLQALLEKTRCTITLLDHHITAKQAIAEKMDVLKPYLQSSPPRLMMTLDLTKSGVGIAYNYVQPASTLPWPFLLVQTMDLLTATADVRVIRQFTVGALDADATRFMESMRQLTTNKVIQENILFFVCAMVFDLEMKKLFKAHRYQLTAELITTVKAFLEGVQFTDLLTPDVRNQFAKQLAEQMKIIANGKMGPSLIADNRDVLFLEGDIRSGRTFEVLIAERLAACTTKTIAMVENPLNPSDKRMIALRGADDSVKLDEMASEYKRQNWVNNAGGHSRAAALQLDRAQLSRLKSGMTRSIQEQGSRSDLTPSFKPLTLA